MLPVVRFVKSQLKTTATKKQKENEQQNSKAYEYIIF